MTYLIILLSIHFLIFTLYLLYKKYNAVAILLTMGSIMTLISYFITAPESAIENNFILFKLFDNIIATFSNRILGVGLLIMLLCGYVEYMRKIKASDVFTYIMMQPLSILRKHPYLAAIVVIPIGSLLTIAIPSATGVALLLVATIYPVLSGGVGLNKISCITIIVACTIWDIGLNSPCTNLAADLLEMNTIEYFRYQMKIMIPMCVICMVTYTLYSYHVYKKAARRDSEHKEEQTDLLNWKTSVPLYYALFPALPLIISILFSPSFFLGEMGYSMGVEGSVMLSLVIVALIDMLFRKSVRDSLAQIQIFWQGMGKIFTSVVVLIVAADIFATGLKDIGFIDSLVNIAQSLNMGETGMTTMLSFTTFFSTVITGSSTVSFDTYANVVVDIATKFNMEPLSLMLPVQIITGFGRAISPISIVIITLSEITDVSPLKIIKQNIIPITVITLIFLAIILNINYNNFLI